MGGLPGLAPMSAHMDDFAGLSCDFDSLPAEPIAPPEDPWLARRLESFGASEVPALLIAIGIEKPTPTTPKYIVELAGRLFAIKAGLRKAKRAGEAASRGNDVEVEVLGLWNRLPSNRWPKAHHAGSVPKGWLPLVDRYCPRLSCTPDAWTHYCGALLNVQIKTDVHGGKLAVTPWWQTQVQAEMAVTASEGALLVYGGGWAGYREDQRQEPRAWLVERDEERIETIRKAVRLGWERVEELKSGKAAKENGHG